VRRVGAQSWCAGRRASVRRVGAQSRCAEQQSRCAESVRRIGASAENFPLLPPTRPPLKGDPAGPAARRHARLAATMYRSTPPLVLHPAITIRGGLTVFFGRIAGLNASRGGTGWVLPRGYPATFLSTTCDGSHWWGHKSFTIFGIWTRSKGPIRRVFPESQFHRRTATLRGMPRSQWPGIGIDLRYTLIFYQSMCDSKQAVGTFGYLGVADRSWLTRLGSLHHLPGEPSASPLSFSV